MAFDSAVPRSWQVAAGVALGAFGLSFLALVLFALHRIWTGPAMLDSGFAFFLVTLFIVGTFCSLLAFRLVMGVNAPGGGVLSARGWWRLGWFFIALGLGFIGLSIPETPGFIPSLILAFGALASGCFVASRIRALRASRKGAA